MAHSPDTESTDRDALDTDAADEPTRQYPAVPEATDDTPAAEAPRRTSVLARVLIFFGVVFALMVAVCLGLRATNVLPSFDNPFADKETDRSQPVLLQSMRDLSRYVAADGTFQVIVDLQQNKENVPDFLLNQRTLFVGSGTVEAYVDFGSLTDGALVVDEEKKTVRIELPAPELSQASLDMSKSYVVAEERGLLNRIGDAFRDDPNQQQRVYQEAQKRITEAARSSGLDARARENTQKMLESLLARLGYTSVTVTFGNP
ncbi:DUF4230 domain-containing protein [Mangrovihabitans endophyticus]|uniref:DUF4230 domain-containing protein n=1 Tax=Mangrovihabitans endophyticus TaxID=1751298 RepID=A0A8J3FQH1_9ACTN|nr:DUF4230 domain-containing protein [Mangrovihabitans endophyticus]GGK98420.1 hypothetical protein GCM10012284_35800 [Mangrovihabitans endophyticus]